MAVSICEYTKTCQLKVEGTLCLQASACEYKYKILVRSNLEGVDQAKGRRKGNGAQRPRTYIHIYMRSSPNK